MASNPLTALIKAGLPKRQAAALLLATTPAPGGGGGGVPVRTTRFQTSNIPRNNVSGAVGTIAWDSVVHTGADGFPTTTPDWKPPYASGDLILTPADGGDHWYEVAVDFSFGLPVADAPAGVSIRLGRDAFDPVHRLFPVVKGAGQGGFAGGFVRPFVRISADDGFRLQFTVQGDPLTSSRTTFNSSGPTSTWLSVTLRKLD